MLVRTHQAKSTMLYWIWIEILYDFTITLIGSFLTLNLQYDNDGVRLWRMLVLLAQGRVSQ